MRDLHSNKAKPEQYHQLFTLNILYGNVLLNISPHTFYTANNYCLHYAAFTYFDMADIT